MRRKYGFTLIELLIVVIIVSVLVALAIPQYTRMVEKTRAVEAVNILGALSRAEDVYYSEHKVFTKNLADLGFDDLPEGDGEALAKNQFWWYRVEYIPGTDHYYLRARRSPLKAGEYDDKIIELYWREAGNPRYYWAGDHPGVPRS